MRQTSRKPIIHYRIYFSTWGLLGLVECRSRQVVRRKFSCSDASLRCLLFSSQKATKITKKKGIKPGDPFRSQLNVLVRSEESFASCDCETGLHQAHHPLPA